MSLPKINTPEYKLNIPSTDEVITYRAFLVKEEKLLLIANETGDQKAQFQAIKQLIKGCVTEKLDIDSLPMFDIEYITILNLCHKIYNMVHYKLNFIVMVQWILRIILMLGKN